MENPAGAVNGNSQNTPTANTPRTRSTFPLQYHMFDTHRFGEYHPHYVEEGVKEDILPIRSSHNVMSYTLKAPLMQDITMKKDYFSVPMESILPLNWEKFFDNPVRGDDVAAEVGPTIEDAWSRIGSMCENLTTSMHNLLTSTTSTESECAVAFFRWLVILEYFYSNGNLLASLGCHGSPYFKFEDYSNGNANLLNLSLDSYFDKCISAFIQSMVNSQGSSNPSFWMSVDGYTYLVYVGSAENYGISLRHALSLMRDNLAFDITLPSAPATSIKTDLLPLIPAIQNIFYFHKGQAPLNLSRLWAYQLVCAHYYTNDHIDFVYSAELYRQLVGNYLNTIYNTSWSGNAYFTRNGIKYQYDYLSAHFASLVFYYIRTTSGILTSQVAVHLSALGYLSALFGYRRSLRYQDYFTGSRAQPLAVGSTGVTVSNNTVDVVDVTRNIQRQRFLNAVNRVRHNFEGYLQGIFGGDIPAPDYHNPFFLASTSDSIYGQETENTGAAQVSSPIAITSNLRSNGSRYMLEIRCDRPCVILGITHYDLPRVYGKSIEREFFHVDRFDMFNPFMQYIGDQPVYLQELGIAPTSSQLINLSNFAYSLRHMEYKQRYNQAAGGFVENLPGFAFLAVDQRGSQNVINPDWIRSVCSEFDDFYVSLNGWSNGSYFHFIVDNYNDCSGSRPMAYAPSIL